MNFAAFNFLGMPYALICALGEFILLTQVRALATEVHSPCTAVATSSHAGAREGQQFSLPMFRGAPRENLGQTPVGQQAATVQGLPGNSGFGVTKQAAGALRGRGAGIFFRPSQRPGSVCMSPARELSLVSLPRGVHARRPNQENNRV